MGVRIPHPALESSLLNSIFPSIGSISEGFDILPYFGIKLECKILYC